MAKKTKVVAPADEQVSATDRWRTVSLGDVVVNRQEQERNPELAGFERYLMVDHLDADRLKIARWGLIADGDLPPTFYKVFRRGQVLYPTRNPHLRRTAYADFDGICGEKTLTLESNGGIEPQLLPFVLQSERFIQFAKSMAIGSTNPHVRWRDIAAYEFPLPPKDEQRRIADILWAADEALEHFGNCERSSTAMLRAFSNECFRIPTNEWESGRQNLVELGQCCAFQSGYPFKSAEFVESGDRLLRCSNVGVNCFNWNPADTRFWPTERRHEV